MIPNLTESTVEEAALSWFGELGYTIQFGPDLSPGELGADRASFGDVALVGRLREAIDRLNPEVPPVAREEALRKTMRADSPSLVAGNRAFHAMLRDGVPVEYRRADGSIAGDRARLVDFDNPDNNDWLAVNQFTVIEGQHNRRADIVVFVNGLPVGVIELKNAADENATIWTAWGQLHTYRKEIPSLFRFNEFLVVSDGLQARIGSLTDSKEWFKVWRSVNGEADAPPSVLELEVLVRGVFKRERLLRLVRHFIAFEEDADDGRVHKLIAGYHQFHAVNVAVEETLRASRPSSLALLPGEKGWMPSSLALLPGEKGWMPSALGLRPWKKGWDEGDSPIIHLEHWLEEQAADPQAEYHYRGGLSFSGLKERARALRQKQTSAEDLVWELLRNRQFLGLKFRRQHQFGPYVADFYCAEKRLVLECDGAIHNRPDREKHDKKRDAYLASMGNRVVKFTNDYVLHHTEEFLERLRSIVALPSPYNPAPEGPQEPSPDHPSPSGRGTEGEGNGRIGVVWHTQGSGKSLSMLFYAGRIIELPEMNNPTLVMLTDRNDLDDQLYGQFLRCHELLRQKPVQAESVAHLRQLLKVASGGVIFTTIQKFAPKVKGAWMPRLSARRNIVVIADEAHRSQYDTIDGLARNLRDALPGASFIGFTGTPIEKKDANTRAIFGDYVSIYDIQRAVRDGATVPIYYESRVAKLSLNAAELPKVDDEFEEITEGEEEERKERLKSKWAALEALVGSEKRVRLIAEDLVEHFERRLEAMDGKAMIVCMSRRICVDIYNALVRLRPQWASAKYDDLEAERAKETVVKIVMTGSASETEWQPHIRTKMKRKELAKRFKDPRDPFRIVIVRDMWLTGFDAPCLHTMYVDKPMRGHGLMQAIARVNRVFRDKPGGLVVDYLGLADQLKYALATYTESGGKGAPSIDTAQAIAEMLKRYEICCDMMHGFKWTVWTTGTPAARLALLPPAQEHILEQEEGKTRFSQAVTELSQAFALCAASDEAIGIRDDISFFQAVRAALAKKSIARTPQEDLDHAVRQLVSKAISAGDEIIDVFSAAGLKKPDISILSDEFLAEVRGLKHKNVAVELLEKLLRDEIKTRSRRNLVQSRLFSEMLKNALNAYHNRAIATQEIIDELIKLAKDMREATQRGIDLGLNEDEICFYDALAMNDSAVQAMGIDELKVIAAELVTQVRKSVTIDWTVRESTRAKIRVMVRRILRKYGYPPDLQEEATRLVLEQAEALCADWVS